MSGERLNRLPPIPSDEQKPKEDTTLSPVDSILSRTKEVAVMPQVVFKIMEMTSSVDSSARILEQAIVVDPGFSARILTQANSAYYALPRKVASIREAVAFLGIKAVRQLSMTIGVFDMFVGKTDRGSMRRRAWWRHSLDTAVCCRFLAEKLGKGSTDQAYTCALLHLLGKTLMDRYDSDEYSKVEALVEKGAMDRMAEQAVYKCDHVEVVQTAARRWRFPEVLIEGVNYIDEPPTDDQNADLKAMVSVSNKVAYMVIAGKDLKEWDTDSVPDWAVSTLGLSKERLALLIDESTAVVAAEAHMSF